MKYVILNIETNQYFNDVFFTGEEGEEVANIEWTENIHSANLMSFNIVNLTFKCIKDNYPNLKIEIRSL